MIDDNGTPLDLTDDRTWVRSASTISTRTARRSSSTRSRSARTRTSAPSTRSPTPPRSRAPQRTRWTRTRADPSDVTVEVQCTEDGGCTLTPGYWKTHSQLGPAPYDDTWALLGPLQEQTIFFLSGMTYYNVALDGAAGQRVLHPRARLHRGTAQLPERRRSNGGSGSFTAATALFNTYTPAQIGALSGDSSSGSSSSTRPHPRQLQQRNHRPGPLPAPPPYQDLSLDRQEREAPQGASLLSGSDRGAVRGRALVVGRIERPGNVGRARVLPGQGVRVRRGRGVPTSAPSR